jgi:hypothetical protein
MTTSKLHEINTSAQVEVVRALTSGLAGRQPKGGFKCLRTQIS